MFQYPLCKTVVAVYFENRSFPYKCDKLLANCKPSFVGIVSIQRDKYWVICSRRIQTFAISVWAYFLKSIWNAPRVQKVNHTEV